MVREVIINIYVFLNFLIFINLLRAKKIYFKIDQIKKIKEQLKTKKRSMVGRQDYLKFQKQFNSGFQNPFYESMKIKEELDFIK